MYRRRPNFGRIMKGPLENGPNGPTLKKRGTPNRTPLNTENICDYLIYECLVLF